MDISEAQDSLRTCPFCAGEPHHDPAMWKMAGGRTGHAWAVPCSRCGASGPGSDDIQEARKHWDVRVSERRPGEPRKGRRSWWVRWVMIFLFRRRPKVTSGLQDADPRSKKSGPSAEPWKEIRVCPRCRESTGQDERVSSLCLSCGQEMSTAPRKAIMRRIFWKGAWTLQLHDQETDFIRSHAKWVPLEVMEAAYDGGVMKETGI